MTPPTDLRGDAALREKRPWKNVKGHTDGVKSFGRWRYASDKELAVCQVEGCAEVASWVTATKKGEALLLCFGHGEDA